ncbi:MAG: DUF2911 domain-containing protein [Saprospiraceae bacterium]|nr:DUF2911 domain-containing protein [Saprospiraceae bacterium]
MRKTCLLAIALLVFSQVVSQNLKTPTLSPFSEIKQEVGLTEITLSYARPSAKGRTVMGNLVPYGEIWRTGANASTKLSFTEDVKIADNDLPAGTYALYTIPNQNEWTIIIHKKTNMRSIAGGRVKAENDAFRFNVKPMTNPVGVETFTMQFTDITTNSCQVQLSWENTIVKFPIEVEVGSKIEAQMAELMKAPDKIPHRTYFRAAEYYLHNKVDLNQAMEWIDAALAKSENNFRYGLLKSKIYNAQGEQEKAVSTVKIANEWATTAKNSNYMEQTSVYLANLQGGAGTSTDEDTKSAKYAEDVASLDNILKALYASISGEKGELRDWDRFRNLFIPEARLMPSSKNKEGKVGYRIMTPDEYVTRSGKWLEENGFHEVEISREEVEYGSLVHVFSTYKSYRSKKDEEPFARGINSIQLMNDGDRWWVIQIYWLGETEALPLPAEYLPKR